jgi:hypothetical protein
MPTIDNLDEVNRVRAYIQALQKEITALKVYPRTFTRYPFDHIGLALVSKAFSLSNALLTLPEAKFADEAFGLSRSLMGVRSDRSKSRLRITRRRGRGSSNDREAALQHLP